jgi:hypothetical protein
MCNDAEPGAATATISLQKQPSTLALGIRFEAQIGDVESELDRPRPR